MQMMLRNLLTELQRRCQAVNDILTNGSFLAPADAYALTLYQKVERLRRNVERLLNDPALGSPPLLARQFQMYKRLAEELQAIEAYPLPLVQRFNENDQRMTALCGLLVRQSSVPLIPPPLVAAFSTNYYWTTPSFNLIFASALEPGSLLGLPDLYHEIAHFLIEAHYNLFVSAFLQELENHILQEQRRAIMEQRPGETTPYDIMLVQWKDYWVIEFVADLIATYLVGEPYAWQNLRLCSRASDTVYAPSLGQQGTHPADNARMKAITGMLTAIGEAPVTLDVQQQWQDYIVALGDGPDSPGDYALCYPDALMTSLVVKVREACEQLGLRKATDCGMVQEHIVLVSLIRDAWQHFLADSIIYASWEQQQLQRLHQYLQQPNPG